ncbi:MAG TPA: 3'-5' exonuclease, partial [Dehalococcoidia bacterium]|nr:3'-5' exonuclease [Dehalococcoidia bacterium]
AVYARTREQFQSNGGLFPRLVMNRRCRRPIVDWVNAVFEALIGDGARPRVQPKYHAIAHTREVDLRGPDVAWFGGEVDDNAAQIRRIEAEAVAAWCWQAVTEPWEVADRDGTCRPARFRDIAILIPTRTSLGALERALQRARIPYRVEGGSLVYQTQEVRDLINCLTAIDDPADEVAIVAALRSPAFACSDVEIARFRAAGGRFDYLNPDLEQRTGPVADALRVLRDYHHRRHDGSLAALVERFARDRGLAEVGILDRGDRNSFRRVRFVVEQARTFEADGPQSLRAFILWLERRATREKMLDHEGAGIDDDEDAVRVLTIHGAKGLEFPIVILAGLGVSPSRDTAILAADRDSERLHLKVGKSSAPGFELGDPALRDAEREHEEAERDRLLYVAATRARDHLLVSLYHRRNSDSFARRLIAAGAQSHAPEAPPPAPVSRAQNPFAGLQVDLPGDADAERFRTRRRELVASATRRRYTSATALGRLRLFAPDIADEEHPTDEGEPWARGKGSTRLGRAVHAAIQSAGLDADEATIVAFARAQAVAEAIPDRAEEVAALVRRALATEAAQRARSAARAVREAPFVVNVDGVTLEGFVDLVIETTEGLEIVDWKTDSVPPDAVGRRLETYRLQAGLYVLGVEAATGKPVRSVTYVFVQPGVERSPGDPAGLAALARSVLAQAAASD